MKTFMSLLRKSSRLEEGMKTDDIIVNLGRRTPPPMGFSGWLVRLNGETIEDLKPVFGDLHRNHAKIGERIQYLQNRPYTDRLDYISSMSNIFGYALTVEKPLNIKSPERAEYIRVIMAELTRITSHVLSRRIPFE